MGNKCDQGCLQDNKQQQPKQSPIIRIERDPQPSLLIFSYYSNPLQLSRMQNRKGLSSIQIKKRHSEFKVLNRELKVEVIGINLQNVDRTFKQCKNPDDKHSIYNLELLPKQQERSKESILSFTFIGDLDRNASQIIIYAGIFNDNKKVRGVYYLIKQKQVFMFRGVFGDSQLFGLKVTSRDHYFQKHWGSFNAQFKPEGKGKAQYYSELNGGYYEQFEGQFKQGLRQGKGILKVKLESQSKDPKKCSNESVLLTGKINKIKSFISHNSRFYEKIVNQLLQFTDKSSTYDPTYPQQLIQDNQCKLILQSTWKRNIIEGLTEQTWPIKHYRFEGEYKNNERNGYGEEYQYDQMIAQGFYRDGSMKTDQNNDKIIMGFKLIDEEWKRNIQ